MFFAVLFGVLVFATSWWSVFGAENLRDNAANRRPLLAEERIKRGTIRSADGKVLARSTKIEKEPTAAGTRAPCSPRSATSFTKLGRSGLEEFYQRPASGRIADGAFGSLLGRRGVGDSIRTTLNSKAQQAAIDGLNEAQGRRGGARAGSNGCW